MSIQPHVLTILGAMTLAISAPSATRAQLPELEQPAAPPREAAPIDLTGQWVAIVNEDWRWRMVTPPKGDFASMPLNAEGRRVGNEWTPAEDGACAAYGAAGLMRLPTRLRIRWDGDDVLVVETDAGMQTRRFLFAAAAEPGPPSLQGRSIAAWRFSGRAGGFFRPGPGASPEGGHLEVMTTNLSGGWLRRNGVPYSEDAVLSEHFDRFDTPGGEEWLMITTVVEDPRYLTQPYVTSSHFKRDPAPRNWNPEPCDE